jgi:glucan phosphoethanolaminetransferase (alkaline phosphatase superfamily)|tara:strand:- start:7443 stop:7769 length:327 start_codon:yes stop_codon:yes gene_type:complete
MDFGTGIFSGTAILIVSAIIILIWLIIEVKRFKHKIFAIFLMILIVFLYIGGIVVFQGKDIDFTSSSGIMDATKIYFSWLSTIFGNFKTMTAGAIQLDWTDTNETSIT